MYGRRRTYVRRSPAARPTYRRSYGRSYGRRYPVRMNDSETRVMSFTQNIERTITVEAGKNGVVANDGPSVYLSGVPAGVYVTPDSGRIYFAGMMYDRFRYRSVSVAVRPKVMPSAVGVSNYTLHLAWDRYKADVGTSDLTANPRIVTDDPSAKMIVWSPGGNASTLTHRVYSTYRDRYQYLSIDHQFPSSGDPARWSASGTPATFTPVLRYVFDIGAPLGSPLSVNLIFQYRYTIEFAGSASMGYGSDAPVSGRSFGVMPLAPAEEDPEA